MSIFTRFRDIVSSNINAMLDQAENPGKMIRLMIREMEDTLVEIKSSCARVMATLKIVKRREEEFSSRAKYWADRAKLAVREKRDDLAREALLEKRRYGRKVEALAKEWKEHNALIEKYQNDIRQLEEKLASAREKQRALFQRHTHAGNKKRAQREIRRMDSSEAMLRFDKLENKIDRLESEAELVNYGKKASLAEAFDNLVVDEDIEKELNELKKS